MTHAHASTPVIGRFVGKAEGAEFDVGGERFRISYVGSDGDDDPNPNKATGRAAVVIALAA